MDQIYDGTFLYDATYRQKRFLYMFSSASRIFTYRIATSTVVCMDKNLPANREFDTSNSSGSKLAFIMKSGFLWV